jgi:ribonuclease HI
LRQGPDVLALFRFLGLDDFQRRGDVLEVSMKEIVDRGGENKVKTSDEILIELDQLRDRRVAKTITEDEYHAESDRLWSELREADRAANCLAKQRTNEDRREARQMAKEEHERRPKVYCDGACEPGQPLGIGVFSADCGIEISLQVDQRGTNNVAECLGAITALEECKKRGILGIRLLSDSRLVVYWTRGNYAMKSATARRYVPTIRRLLSEVGGVIEWIPGSQNLADKYSRGLQDYRDDLSPLEKLKTIPNDRLAFKDFLGVKSGRDEFSNVHVYRCLRKYP